MSVWLYSSSLRALRLLIIALLVVVGVWISDVEVIAAGVVFLPPVLVFLSISSDAPTPALPGRSRGHEPEPLFPAIERGRVTSNQFPVGDTCRYWELLPGAFAGTSAISASEAS